jgi:hypothetical protein
MLKTNKTDEKQKKWTQIFTQLTTASKTKHAHTNRWQENHEDQNNNFFFFFFFCLPEDDSVPQHDIVVLRSTADSCWWIMLQTLEVSHQSLSGWGRHGAVTKPAVFFLAARPSHARGTTKTLLRLVCYPPALVDLEHLRSGFPLPHHPRQCN